MSRMRLFWVMRRIVQPLCLVRVCMSSTTSRPDFLSRAAVGSSARTILGWETSARAATRCFWTSERPSVNIGYVSVSVTHEFWVLDKVRYIPLTHFTRLAIALSIAFLSWFRCTITLLLKDKDKLARHSRRTFMNKLNKPPSIFRVSVYHIDITFMMGMFRLWCSRQNWEPNKFIGEVHKVIC